jgi:hypothetical protein
VETALETEESIVEAEHELLLLVGEALAEVFVLVGGSFALVSKLHSQKVNSLGEAVHLPAKSIYLSIEVFEVLSKLLDFLIVLIELGGQRE